MKPPRCYVCGRGLEDVPDDEEVAAHFTLVQFGLDAEEQAAERDRDAAGWTGQPTGAVWFCRRHVDLAEPHVRQPWRAALAAIDKAVDEQGADKQPVDEQAADKRASAG